MLQLPAGHMRTLAEYQFARYFVELPPGIAYADLFNPGFWAHHQRLKKFDVIRVVAHDWSFDVELTVTAKTKGGASVQLFPFVPADSGDVEVRYVPKLKNGKLAIRVEYQKATKWRIIALDGSEHSREYETEGLAIGAMHNYVRELGLQFPPEGVEPSDDDLERMTAPAAKDLVKA